jgi:hypothetical protein
MFNNLATLNTLEAFLAGIALARVFCLALALAVAMVTGGGARRPVVPGNCGPPAVRRHTWRRTGTPNRPYLSRPPGAGTGCISSATDGPPLTATADGAADGPWVIHATRRSHARTRRPAPAGAAAGPPSAVAQHVRRPAAANRTVFLPTAPSVL